MPNSEGLLMVESKTYTGGCHCGQVRFECTTDLAMVTACNCSICTKKGLHFTFLPPRSFQLRAGGENLKEYLFNKHAIRHQLCNDCGVDVFARGNKPDGAEVVAGTLTTYAVLYALLLAAYIGTLRYLGTKPARSLKMLGEIPQAAARWRASREAG